VRILFLHLFDLDLAGGSGVYLRALTRALGELGHEVEVVSARHGDRYGSTTYALPFEFVLTFGPEKRPGEKTFDELSSAELSELAESAADAVARRSLVARSPQLLVVNHISVLALTALRLQRRFAVPYRVISYGTDTQLLARDRRYVDLLEEAAERADRVFAISRFVARQVAATLPRSRVETLGGAVDPDLFYRPANGSNGQPPRQIAFVGRLVTEKGIWVLLDALQAVGDGYELAVAGEGPLRGAIATRLERSALRERVHLLGYVPPSGLRDVLIRSCLLVVPSTWEEPLGLVILEALACGVPVVASAVGGIPEIVLDGVNGCLVPPGDAGRLAETLDRLRRDDALYRRLRANCLATDVPTYRGLAGRLLA
jgi:glycosyltransferase involved in cell wall biosynthesis